MERNAESHLRTVRLTPYRKGCGPSFTLRMWDAGTRANTGQHQVSYTLTMTENGKSAVLFDGSDIGISPMHAIDSDEAVAAVLGWLTLRRGDTDAEFFADDTPEVAAYRAKHAESLGCEASFRFGEG